MRIVKPSFEILPLFSGDAALRHIETCGRVCYKSEDRIRDDSAADFVAGIIRRGHESVLEHISVTARAICDRGISHEVVRHRIAAYSQESTRYCNYSEDRFSSEITVIEPLYLERGTRGYDIWKASCESDERNYFELLDFGCVPQEARCVLPHSTKTELIMTFDLREWRHFFKLRCSKAAHPQMREVMSIGLHRFKSYIPVVFDDIKEG